jgi:hypothetical protein
MNTILKVGAASALALGAVAAHAAIPQPTTGASDAILFAEVISNLNTISSAVVASYAGDTGVSINSLVAGLNGTTNALAGDANLAKLFAANAAGDTIVWSVQGGQWTGANNATNFAHPGVAKFITTSFSDATGNIATKNAGNLQHWSGLDADITTINSNAGGGNSVEGPAAATAGVWDLNSTTGISAWYGNGPGTSNSIGASQKLFFVTGGGTSLAKVAFSNPNGETATLSAAGVAFTGGSAVTPLPAAVWLFGSGLLGLTGIARRKSKA